MAPGKPEEVNAERLEAVRSSLVACGLTWESEADLVFLADHIPVPQPGPLILALGWIRNWPGSHPTDDLQEQLVDLCLKYSEGLVLDKARPAPDERGWELEDWAPGPFKAQLGEEHRKGPFLSRTVRPPKKKARRPARNVQVLLAFLTAQLLESVSIPASQGPKGSIARMTGWLMEAAGVTHDPLGGPAHDAMHPAEWMERLVGLAKTPARRGRPKKILKRSPGRPRGTKADED